MIDNVLSQGTLDIRYLVRYSKKDIQNIPDIRKNTQYQEICCLFTPPNTFL